MINFILQHKVMMGVVGALVAILVWMGLSTSSTSSGSLLTTQTVDQGPDRELVSTLLALRAVKLDGSIFTDPAFVSLKDFSTAIIPEPVGRPNPFAPLSQTAAATAASTNGAQIFQTPKKSP